MPWLGLSEGKKAEPKEKPLPPQIIQAIRDEGLFSAKKLNNNERAVETLTTALSLDPTDRSCLLSRARCYLDMGIPEPALADCNAALEDVKDTGHRQHLQALYLKAEAFYAMGDFETALVFFHRGCRLGPKDLRFRLGITRCQHTINNSIGTPQSVNLRSAIKLFPVKKQRKTSKMRGCSVLNKEAKRSNVKADKPTSHYSALLGPLYPHFNFLESLYTKALHTSHHMDPTAESEALLIKDSSEAVKFLTQRADFWQQESPLYTRERNRRKELKSSRAHLHTGDPMLCMLQELDVIDHAMDKGEYQKSLMKAGTLLTRLLSYGERFVQRRLGLLAIIYNAMGTACMHMGLLHQALEYHKKDFRIGDISNVAVIRSRALDNIGKTKARMGKYEEAIEIWNRKKVRSGLEAAWVHSEIGRCLLHLGRYHSAKAEAKKSFHLAEEIHHDRWQMHALILLGEAELGLERTHGAELAFENAWIISKSLKDRKARDAIEEALLVSTGRVLQDSDYSTEWDESGSGSRSWSTQSRLDGSSADRGPGLPSWLIEIAEEESDDQETQPKGTHLKSILSSRGSKPQGAQSGTGFKHQMNALNQDARHPMTKKTSVRKIVSIIERLDPHAGHNKSGNFNNSVPVFMETTTPSTSEESSKKVETGTEFRYMPSHKAKKNSSRMKDTEKLSNRNVDAKNVTFQLKRVSRPQTANLVRPKLVRDSRPKTTAHQERKLAKTRKSGKHSKAKTIGGPEDRASSLPPPSTSKETGVASCRQRDVSTDEDNLSDRQFSDVQHEGNNSNSSVRGYNLFNVSSSESSDERPARSSDDIHFSSTSFPNDCPWNTNSDDRYHSADILKEDTHEDTFYAVSDISASEFDKQPDQCVQNTASGSEKPHLMKSYLGDGPKTCMSGASRSCYPLPQCPLRTGSDTHIWQAGHSKSDSSSNMFYSDSRIKNWASDVQSSFSSLVSDRATRPSDSARHSSPVTLGTPNYSLEGQDNYLQHQRWRDGSHNETSGGKQSTSQPQKPNVSETHDTIPGSETDFSESNVQSRQRSVNSSGGSTLTSATLVDPTQPRMKGTRMKSAASSAAPVGRSASSGRVSFPSASASPKRISAGLLLQVYDPHGSSIQTAASKKGRPSSGKKLQPKLAK